jgi:hypothetical protein
MGVDFNRIDLGISSGFSRNGFGTIVSNLASVSVPAAGTLLSTADDYALTIANYPSVETVTVVHDGGTIVVPNQTGDVPIRADGSGGSYYDYTTVTDVKYKANGTWIDETYFSSPPYLYVNPVYINISGTNYANGDGYINVSQHNGSGGYFNDYRTRTPIGYGFPIVITTYEQSSTPFGDMNDGRVVAHWSDGNGSYFTSSGGWVWDSANSTGDYRSSGGYFEYGHYLGYDSSMNQTFYWNGSGGYYS